MIDRAELVKRVERQMKTERAAEVIVDEILIPELARHQDQNVQMQIAAVVDASGLMYQASIQRQRAAIDRLLEENRRLKSVGSLDTAPSQE